MCSLSHTDMVVASVWFVLTVGDKRFVINGSVLFCHGCFLALLL